MKITIEGTSAEVADLINGQATNIMNVESVNIANTPVDSKNIAKRVSEHFSEAISKYDADLQLY